LRRANPLHGFTVACRNGLLASLLITAAFLCADVAAAQPVHPPPTAAAAPDAAAPGSELTVYLMTMGPGDEVWEKFGHNAIWIHDSLRNIDVAYNWGLFDFAAADFFPRFLKGNMRYWMGGFDQRATVDFYRQANRSVSAQELNLTPAQRVSLAQFVEWNAQPENRFYNYDYYRDNCSTRVRDALDRALGGVIRRSAEHAPTGTTYRFHTRRLTQDAPWVYLGTLLGLGHPVDRPISRWEEMFLPVRLHDDIQAVRVADSSGASVPLVKSEAQLFVSSREPEPLRPRNHIWIYLIAGTAVGVAVVLLRHLADDGKRGARTGLLLTAGVFQLAVGLGGVGLTALWALTNHVYSYYNENLLQANDLSLILAVLIIASVWRRTTIHATASDSGLRDATQSGIVGAFTSRLAWLVAGLALLGLVIKILPAFNQVNGEIIALLLPAHLGIALSLGSRSPWPTSSGKIEPAPAA
jgi:hypothetical protein